jgi:hypothetical protein
MARYQDRSCDRARPTSTLEFPLQEQKPQEQKPASEAERKVLLNLRCDRGMWGTFARIDLPVAPCPTHRCDVPLIGAAAAADDIHVSQAGSQCPILGTKFRGVARIEFGSFV